MGGAVSYAAAAAVKPSQTEGKEEKHSKDVDSVDWLNLPCPVKYEEIQRENISKIRGLILIPCLSLVSCQGVGMI
jgi:hypothetical protein